MLPAQPLEKISRPDCVPLLPSANPIACQVVHEDNIGSDGRFPFVQYFDALVIVHEIAGFSEAMAEPGREVEVLQGSPVLLAQRFEWSPW